MISHLFGKVVWRIYCVDGLTIRLGHGVFGNFYSSLYLAHSGLKVRHRKKNGNSHTGKDLLIVDTAVVILDPSRVLH